MNKALILAAPLLVLAAACTSTGGTHAQVAAAAPAGGAQYCKKDRLMTEAGGLTCSWSPTIGDACENNNLTTLGASSVASGPSNAGRCGNGQWLVSVTTK